MTVTPPASPAQGNPRLLRICCAVCFCCFFGAYMRIPVFPLHAASLGADTVRVGMLNALFLLMAGSLCVPAGMLSDRVGRRLPIMAGILVLGCSSLGLSFSSSVAHLAAVCVLSGIGTAVFAPPLMSYVADITPPARLGSAFGWYTTCLYGGMTIGPAAGGLLGRTLGFRPVFLISGLLIVALFGVVLFFLPPSRPHGTTAPQPAGAALLSTLCNRRLLVCLGSLLGSCIGYGLFITFMPLYARSLGLDSGHIGLVFAVQALSNALSRIPFGRLGDRLGDRSVLVVTGLVGFSLSLAILAGAKSLGLLLLGAAAFGVTLGVAFTALVALTADAAPREQRGLALGLYNSCLYLGMMLSSALMGLVIRRHGYGTAFYLCGGITLAVALLFFCLYRRPPAAAPEAAAWEASP